MKLSQLHTPILEYHYKDMQLYNALGMDWDAIYRRYALSSYVGEPYPRVDRILKDKDFRRFLYVYCYIHRGIKLTDEQLDDLYSNNRHFVNKMIIDFIAEEPNGEPYRKEIRDFYKRYRLDAEKGNFINKSASSSGYVSDYRKIVKAQWLMHFTTHIAHMISIFKDGFKIGSSLKCPGCDGNGLIIKEKDVERCSSCNGTGYSIQDATSSRLETGLNSSYLPKTKSTKPGYVFAYPLNTNRCNYYHNFGVVFWSSGIEIYHVVDMEKQIMVWGPSIDKRYIFPFYMRSPEIQMDMFLFTDNKPIVKLRGDMAEYLNQNCEQLSRRLHKYGLNIKGQENFIDRYSKSWDRIIMSPTEKSIMRHKKIPRPYKPLNF